MPDLETVATMLQGMGGGGGRSGGGDRDLYQKWQEALARLEQLQAGAPGEVIAPRYRVDPNTNEREYNIGGRWAKQSAYEDPEFQALVVEPWMEKERQRRREAYEKQVAFAKEAAAMREYDYNDYQRRQEELKGNSPYKSAMGRPQQGGPGMRSNRSY